MTHLKHRAVLLTLYSAGLRLTEATNLKASEYRLPTNADQDRQGKGRQKRPFRTALAPAITSASRVLESSQANRFSFPGQDSQCATSWGYDSDLLQDGGAAKAHLNKHVTPHTLRHSFATSLLGSGSRLDGHQQVLLGHSSFTTTMIYLHCRRQHLDSIPAPSTGCL